jgi:hypothetical protein
MSAFRIAWQDGCAILAITSGLLFAATCLADDPWPNNVGPHTDKSGPCNIYTTDCFGGISCVNKLPSDPPDLWTCPDGFAYLSYKRIQTRQYGYCYNATGSCTYYDKYYCAEVAVYQPKDCGDPEKCRYWVWASGACGPS